jgi:hypothetical protein
MHSPALPSNVDTLTHTETDPKETSSKDVELQRCILVVQAKLMTNNKRYKSRINQLTCMSDQRVN